MPNLSPTDANFLRMAYEEALAGFNEGGCPIGSVLGSTGASLRGDVTSASSRAIRSPTARWIACARLAARSPTAR